MMKRQKTSKRKLFHMAWGIPVLAFMLVAFAEPKYQPAAPVANKVQPASKHAVKAETTKTIHGFVVNEKGKPMPAVAVVIRGTTKGMISDMQGKFSLDVPEKGCDLALSYIGYKTMVTRVTPTEKSNYEFHMEKTVIGIDAQQKVSKPTAPSQPTTETSDKKEKVFVIVEDMPQYPGGRYGLQKYIDTKRDELYKEAASQGQNLKGKAYVNFVVEPNGSVDKIKVGKSSGSKYADKKAFELVQGMDKWSPGKQRGKAVPVSFSIVIEF